jgi:nucleoside triphosphate pyrophosphatase
MADKLTNSGRPLLVLASSSPRRAELLGAAGIPFVVRAANVDETRRQDEPPVAYVGRLSRDKALAVRNEDDPSELILGADTTVVIADEVAGKPVDDEDAVRMLRGLSGVWHEVLTAVTLLCGEDSRVAVEVTRVKFAPLTDKEIRRYVASGEPRDKAGAYAIQGYAALFIERIEGSYSNVVGLPVRTVYELARELGVELI